MCSVMKQRYLRDAFLKEGVPVYARRFFHSNHGFTVQRKGEYEQAEYMIFTCACCNEIRKLNLTMDPGKSEMIYPGLFIGFFLYPAVRLLHRKIDIRRIQTWLVEQFL